MKQLWLKVWSWYTGNTYVRHTVTVALAYIIVHYAAFLTDWAPASDQTVLTGLWTTVVTPLIRLAIKWAESILSNGQQEEPAA